MARGSPTKFGGSKVFIHGSPPPMEDPGSDPGRSERPFKVRNRGFCVPSKSSAT